MAAVAERRFLHTFTRGSHEGRDREEAAPPMLTTGSRETELTGATVVVADVDVAATAVAETANKQEQRRAPSFLTVTTTTISFLPVAADRCFE